MELETTSAGRTSPRGLGAATMVEAFRITVEDRAEHPAIRTKEDAESYTWAEYSERVARTAAGLAALGVQKGDTVGLMLSNRPEFHFADAAAIHLGATPFSLYNTSAPEQITYVVEDAANRVLFTEQAFLDPVLEVREEVGALEHVVVVDGEARGGAITLEQLDRGGREDFDLEAAWRAVEPDDLLTLIYTSGTTGPPKGVELTHRNMLTALRIFDELVSVEPEGRVISWLPMAHIAERNISHYLPMAVGVTSTCCPDPSQLVAYLPEVRPTWFFAVPRVWEKMMAALETSFETEEHDALRRKTAWALEVGRRKTESEQAGEAISAELAAEYREADETILSKVRERLGLDRLEAVNVAAAPTPREVIEFFHALGIPLQELWGLSESTATGTWNPRDRIKIGTVGPAAPGMELKLAEDGEILLRGATLMAGYRNKPELTAEAIDADGWLRTGDVGELDDDGYLTIVDRKKELIINATGKNMSPANIEATIKSASPLIGQACAVGDGRPYNVALIVLDPDAAPVFAKQHGFEDATMESLVSEQAVIDEVAEGVERGNTKLARIEQIKRFKLLPAEWEPGGDELTPTMKLKRRPVEEKYAAEIDALYAE